MPANVEIKARVHDMRALQERAERVSGGPPEICMQEDVFFKTDRGRLKLRMVAGRDAQLISYERDDEPGPKRSSYFLCPVADPAALTRVLEATLGVRGIVRKRRSLYWAGRTRIHLDEVEGLGAFAELEVILEPNDTQAAAADDGVREGAAAKRVESAATEREATEREAVERGLAEAHRLMGVLGINESDLVAGAYIDLLEARHG